MSEPGIDAKDNEEGNVGRRIVSTMSTGVQMRNARVLKLILSFKFAVGRWVGADR